MANEQFYIIITTILCIMSLLSALFSIFPWILLFKVMKDYREMLEAIAELTQDMRQTTHHVATVVHNFTEIVNKNAT